MRPTVSNGDFAGLRSMLVAEVSRWLAEELKPIEEKFPPDVEDTYRDVLERFLMYLVMTYGEKSPDGSYGRNVSESELNILIGADAKLDVESDRSITLTVRLS